MKFSSSFLVAPLLLAAGAAAIATPDDLATRDVQYIAKAGDTGDSIAQANNIDFTALAAANTFVDWNNLWIGTALTIPAAAGAGGASGSKMARRDGPYIVVTGDTGTSIAQAHGVDFTALAAANTFVDWNDLWVGTPLSIPAGGTGSNMARRDNAPYIAVAGDTGNSIAKAHNIDFNTLAAANKFVDWNNLWVGTPLTIPGSSADANPAAASSAVAAVAPSSVASSAATSAASSAAASSAAPTTFAVGIGTP